MPEKGSQQTGTRLPQGFTVHSSGRASEHAREQGWGINEEERTKTPLQKQSYDGGRDYDYGAQDFGDVPEDTSGAKPAVDPNRTKPLVQRRKKAA